MGETKERAEACCSRPTPEPLGCTPQPSCPFTINMVSIAFAPSPKESLTVTFSTPPYSDKLGKRMSMGGGAASHDSEKQRERSGSMDEDSSRASSYLFTIPFTSYHMLTYTSPAGGGCNGRRLRLRSTYSSTPSLAISASSLPPPTSLFPARIHTLLSTPTPRPPSFIAILDPSSDRGPPIGPAAREEGGERGGAGARARAGSWRFRPQFPSPITQSASSEGGGTKEESAAVLVAANVHTQTSLAMTDEEFFAPPSHPASSTFTSSASGATR